MFRFVRGRVRLLFFPGFIIFYAEKSNRLWGDILLEIIIITFTTCFFLCLRVDPGKRARCPTTVVRLAFLLLLEQRLTVVHRSAVKPDRFYLRQLPRSVRGRRPKNQISPIGRCASKRAVRSAVSQN